MERSGEGLVVCCSSLSVLQGSCHQHGYQCASQCKLLVLSQLPNQEQWYHLGSFCLSALDAFRYLAAQILLAALVHFLQWLRVARCFACEWKAFRMAFQILGALGFFLFQGLLFFFSGCAGKAISWCVERKFREFLEKREIQEKKKKAKTILALSLLVKSLGKFSGWEVFLFFVLGR